MHIAHVLSSFGMGGQERIAVDLAARQCALGHAVTAVSLCPPPDGPHRASFEAAGVSVVTLPKKDGGTDPKLTLRLRALFQELGTDVVHTHNPQPLIYAAPAGKLMGARVIHTKHGANPAPLRQKLLRRTATLFADAYVAVSATTADVARSGRECSQAQLHVIENGIDLSRFVRSQDGRTQVRRELSIPEQAVVVGTVGRLAPEKNQGLMLDALRPLLGPEARLVLVGDGERRASLEQRARELGIERWVHFLGVRKDTPQILSAMDVFVLSSDTEGLPLVIPEAMAVGLPVVSTAVGGIPTVVKEGRTGLLIPAGDAEALRSALHGLMADPERRRRMGARARDDANATYSADRMTERYLDLYCGKDSRSN